MEQFYFNVDGKIEYVEQWIRDKKEWILFQKIKKALFKALF